MIVKILFVEECKSFGNRLTDKVMPWGISAKAQLTDKKEMNSFLSVLIGFIPNKTASFLNFYSLDTIN